MSFDEGTFVVDDIIMAQRSGNFANPAAGTLNIGGGVFTVNDSFSVASKTGSGGSAVGRVNITGDGLLITFADITSTGTVDAQDFSFPVIRA